MLACLCLCVFSTEQTEVVITQRLNRCSIVKEIGCTWDSNEAQHTPKTKRTLQQGRHRKGYDIFMHLVKVCHHNITYIVPEACI